MKEESHGAELRSDVARELIERGIVLQNGHYECKNRDHVTDVVDTNGLYEDPRLLARIAGVMALQAERSAIDTVAGLTGDEHRSSYLAILVASALPHATYVALRKQGGAHSSVDARDDARVRNKRVLLVDDVVGTGETVLTAVRTLGRYRADVAMIATICDRGDVFLKKLPTQNDIVYHTLIRMSERRWTKALCKTRGPCKQGVRLTEIGTRSFTVPFGK